MLSQKDLVRFEHMRDACAEALGYVAGRSREDLDTDRQLSYAVTYCLLILGEAANAVSAQGRAAYPGLPWTWMIRTRNRLVHAYFVIDLNVLWKTLKQNIPPLLDTLQGILGEAQQESKPQP